MSVRGGVVRAVAVVGLGVAQLRRAPGRTALAVAAVALAVLAVTLLASLGVGVVDAGQDGLEDADRDIWITSEPVDTAPGGTENSIVGAHAVAADVSQREDVDSAAPIAMHSTYVGTDPDELRSVSAVGVPETHGGFEYEDGGGFEADDSEFLVDPPDDPEPTEIVVDPDLAAELDVGVGDTLYVGVSQEPDAARAFTVVGLSGHYSQYLGEPAITVPLAELQALAGSRGADRASFITVDVEDGADREAVRDDVAADYPEYDVRTSDEQLLAMLEDRALVVASGVTLVGLAIVGGIVLTANLFVLVAYQQRVELAALRALGLSRSLLAGLVGAQGLLIGVLGGIVALAATRPLVGALNELARTAVGFDSLLQTPPAVYAVGAAVAVGVGTVSALVAGWAAGRYASIGRLEG
ncbi:ABC transporter permease [Halovivax sp.]|uniref:ABC transporter permease n=1 Tax=Halovivax sp. TaxID=1935978 RepID=UPI0025B7EE3C|nr:ABC transporter permease [Halovivax sp.]